MNYVGELEPTLGEDHEDIRFTLVGLLPTQLLEEDSNLSLEEDNLSLEEDNLSEDDSYLIDLPTLQEKPTVRGVCPTPGQPRVICPTPGQPLVPHPRQTLVPPPGQRCYKELVVKDGRYKCPYCDKTYANKYIVPRHVKLEHENQWVVCGVCGVHVKNIAMHNRKKHQGETAIKCLVCLKVLSSKREMKEHCLEDHGAVCTPAPQPREMVCPVCNLVVVNKRSLWIQHIFYQHMVLNKFFQCPLPHCSAPISKIVDDYNLKKHLQTAHELEPEKIFSCNICPGKTLSLEDLEVHCRLEHRDNKFKCCLCTNNFDCYSMMALHVFQDHKCILRGQSNTYKNAAKLFEEKEGMSLRPKKIKYKIQLSSKKDGTEETILPSQNISSIPVETTPIVSKSSNVAFATAFSKPAIYSSTTPKSLMPGDEFISIYQPHYKTTESGLNLPDGVQVIKEEEDTLILEMDDSVPGKANLSEEHSVLPLNTHEMHLELEDFGSMDADYQNILLETQSQAYDNEEESGLSNLPEDFPSSMLPTDPMNQFDMIGCEAERQTPDKSERAEIVDDALSKCQNTVKASKDVEADKPSFECSWEGCDKTFLHKNSVGMHIRNVHEAQQIKCSHCGKFYSNLDNYKTHLKSVHSSKTAECTWPDCKKVLANARQMRSHLIKHTQPEQGCPRQGCKAVLKNLVTLRAHLNKVHKPRLKESRDQLVKPGSLNTKKKGCKVDQCDKVDLHYRQLWLDEDEQSDQLSEVSVKTQKGKQPTITTYKIKKLSS